jgi:hypothetical protein
MLNFIKSVSTHAVIATCTVILVLAFFIGIIAMARWWSSPDDLPPPAVAQQVLHSPPALVLHVDPKLLTDRTAASTYNCGIALVGLTASQRAARVAQCGPNSVR